MLQDGTMRITMLCHIITKSLNNHMVRANQNFISLPSPSYQTILESNHPFSSYTPHLLHTITAEKKPFHHTKAFCPPPLLTKFCQPPYFDFITWYHSPPWPLIILHFHFASLASLKREISFTPQTFFFFFFERHTIFHLTDENLLSPSNPPHKKDSLAF